MTLPGDIGLLKDRNILFIVSARFISRLGGTAAFFIGVWGTAAYEFHATTQQLAFLMMGSAIAGALGSMIAGGLIDRFGPRRVLIGAEILTVPMVLMLAASTSLTPFIFWNAGFAFVGVPTFTAGASFAPYLVRGARNLEKMNSLIETAGSLGFVLGPAVGALVSRSHGPRSVLFVMAGASVVAALLALLARVDDRHRDVEHGHPLAELRDGLKLAYSVPELRFLLLTATTIWFGFGAFSALEPLFYRDVVHVGPEWIGWINTLYGGGMVFGAWILPRLSKRIMSMRGVLVMTALVGAGTLAYVGTDKIPTIALGAVVWGVIIGATIPLIRTLLHVSAPRGYVGRVMGALQYHQSAAELLPLAIAPAFATIFGVQPVLIAGGVLVALTAIAAYPVATRIDHATAGRSAHVRDASSAIADV